MDTTSWTAPKYTGAITRSKNKLLMDNVPIPVDDSIKIYVRSKKKPYKEVSHKSTYVPTESQVKVTQMKPRRSERLRQTATWAPSKVTKAMKVSHNGILILPSAIHALPAYSGFPVDPVKMRLPSPLKDFKIEEKTRVYHAQLDLLASSKRSLK